MKRNGYIPANSAGRDALINQLLSMYRFDIIRIRINEY